MLVIIAPSCRSVRLLEPDQALVTKVQMHGIDRNLKEEASEYVQQELRPNSFSNLFIYNLANGKKGRYRTQNIRRVGEPPSILDTALVEISTTQIRKFLNNKGYLDAEVKSETKVRRKRARLTFWIDQGESYTVDYKTKSIADPVIDSIYTDFASTFSAVQIGKALDIDSLATERERIHSLMQQHGYFDFLRQYVRFEVDTNGKKGHAAVAIIIDNPEGKTAHTKFKIDSSYVTIKKEGANALEVPEVTEVEGSVKVSDYSGKFKAKQLSRYLFLKHGKPYNSALETTTYNRLYELNTFRSIKIAYEKQDSVHLNAHYELVPNKRMSNRVEGEFTFNSGRSGFNVGNTYTNRNLLGGSEQLEVKLSYGVLFDSRVSGNLIDKVFNQDIQIGATLTFPRLMLPFKVSSVEKNGMPRTSFSTSWQKFEQRDTYSNRYMINSLTYSWNDTKYKVHHVTPVSLEYRVGRLASGFREQLLNEGFGLYVASNDRAYFGLGSAYSYTYNSIRLNELENFVYFRGALDISGNTLSLFANTLGLHENRDGQKTVFGVPFLQYAKVETDFRWYQSFGGDRQLVIRLNPGIAIPYGNNANFLIFEKSFYGGGMNGVRAWQARTLGPGGYNREVVPDSLRLNFRNLDQLGEIKLEGNIEYRFKILNNLFGAKLKGATFVDVGNIWRLKENDINPGGKFSSSSFLSELAIGTGLGLRFDVNYFVFRLDAGIKVRDPQFKGKDRWVIRDLFKSAEFKEKYNATHFPDRYNFIQYNFGIGMPF